MKLQCSSDIDIFTQNKLPNKEKDIVILNSKKPYHCVDLVQFFNYWKSIAKDGLDIKNPMTNKKISEKKLNEIWLKIKKNIPNAKKPTKSLTKIKYGWNASGEQIVRRVRNEDAEIRLIERYKEEYGLRFINLIKRIKKNKIPFDQSVIQQYKNIIYNLTLSTIDDIKNELDALEDLVIQSGGKSKVQSLLFDKKKFDATTARKWLKKNNYKAIKRVHKTNKYLRYRIIKINKKHKYKTINFGKNIKAIVIY